MSAPTAIVLAGINGAGKTTASRALLADTLGLMTFVNADVIAQGLSGFDPESAAFEASRIMLERLHALTEQRADFAFETTLAARSYAGWLRSLVASGYEAHLYYFWLPSPELAIERVAARVRNGGHHIPDDTVRRRYGLSIRNLFSLYIPVVTRWAVYDNFGQFPRPIADGSVGTVDAIHDASTWDKITGGQASG